MAGTTAQQDAFAARVVVPVTALTMLAVQVGSNAARDALFLSSFSVTTLPWFVALAAVVTFIAAPGTGSLLVRYGPSRTVPANFLRSSDVGRIRPALRLAVTEPALVGAVIPLLARKDLVDEVGTALRAHGARVAGQLVDVLVDPATPEIVRRRLPMVLKSCVSRRAFEGLIEGLSDSSFTVRQRCCRALLQMTADNAVLRVPMAIVCAAAEGELDDGSGNVPSLAHVFDLLALAFDGGMIAFARRAGETGDARARGTALVYLEAVLPRSLFAKLEQRIAPPVLQMR